MYREVVEQGHGFPVKEAVETALGDWLSVEAIQNRELVTEICAVGRLDEGESEAIVLAQECHADRILSTRREANIENRQMNADQIR